VEAIDWPALARGALRIVGLSISLAAFSHMRWAAQQMGVPLRTALGWDSFFAPFFAGLVLFSAGLAWGAARPGETAAWGILAVLFAWQALVSVRSRARGPR